MAPTVRISDQTLDRLKSWAEPLVDTVEDAMNKVLADAEAYRANHPSINRSAIKLPMIKAYPSTDGDTGSLITPRMKASRSHTLSGQVLPVGNGHRLSKGLKTSQAAFREPILTTLRTLGGRASTQDLRIELEKLLRSSLNQYDLARVKSGSVRWWNSACFERKVMVDDGLLAANSPTGVWQLTVKGRTAAAQPQRP